MNARGVLIQKWRKNANSKSALTNPEEITNAAPYGVLAKEAKRGISYPDGSFSIQINHSYIIRNGRVCERLPSLIISGNVQHTMRDIKMVGSDQEIFPLAPCGKRGLQFVGYGAPTPLVGKLDIEKGELEVGTFDIEESAEAI